jgi:hypothetical protein
MDIEVDSVIAALSSLGEILEENERLKEELANAREAKQAAYDLLRDYDNDILNYKGALKRREDEIHVLYHKVSTLLGDKKPQDYDKFNVETMRRTLQSLLDEVEPVNITFAGTDKVWTLSEYGAKQGVSAVSNYPEERLTFC